MRAMGCRRVTATTASDAASGTVADMDSDATLDDDGIAGRIGA
jgi:hypothetical protein